jgi:NAD(P)-dependent dehydrogenase (short-subunit alcohol dehydrogenase family)
MSTVIVTGAASGMGRAAVNHLAEKGVDVLAVDRDAERLEQLRSEVAGNVVPVVADVTVEEDVRAYADAAREAFGTVDGFFNQAGITGARQPIVELSLEAWRHTVAVNLDAVFLGLKHVIPLLRRPGGAVVTTSSISAYRAEVKRADYVATKAAVIGLTQTAAAEHGPEGLRFNCIVPGPIDTPMMAEHESWVDASATDEVRAQIEGMNALRRYGTTTEIAELVEFLLLGPSTYITAAAIPVDGGFLAI